MNLRSIARALDGEISGQQVLAPGPGHSKRDRSLSVRLSPGAPDGFLAFSHAGDDWRECRDYVRAKLGIAPERRERVLTMRQAPEPRPNDDNRTRDAARRLFQESVDARGMLAERYLTDERGLPGVIDDVLALTLRFHASCPFRDGETLVRAPAIIAALRDPQAAMHACSHLDDMDAIERRFLADPANVKAVQRIRLDDKGRKVERRSLGPLENSVVFIGSIWEPFYSATATIAEGVESALAARKLGFTGVVAITGVSRLRTFQPPFIWGSITGIAENDEASENAWRAAAPRWREKGHRVRVVAPPSGDANDYLKGVHHGR